jgi:hypothetical protein
MLPGLDDEMHSMLMRLARHSLDRLGVKEPENFLADEMRRQFSLIAMELPSGQRRDDQLRAALSRALEEYEEA